MKRRKEEKTVDQTTKARYTLVGSCRGIRGRPVQDKGKDQRRNEMTLLGVHFGMFLYLLFFYQLEKEWTFLFIKIRTMY